MHQEPGRRAGVTLLMEMEYWTWPPSYDPAYVPPLDQEYWFPVRETMDPEQRDQAILAPHSRGHGVRLRACALLPC